MICIPLSGIGFEECKSMVRKENFVEFRFDLLTLTLEQVRELVGMATSCIATCRPGKMDEPRRLEILQTAMASGADYVDVEVESDPALLAELLPYARSHGTSVIISYHNFKSTPDMPELEKIVEKCREAGADIIKIASHVNRAEDLQNLFKLYRKDYRMVIIGMGKLGVISRIAGPFLGAEFTFAAPETGKETAPGQISKDQLLSIIGQIKES
jgi:3-dehydroquinate dehydratase type I